MARRKKQPLPDQGAAFAVRLPDGRFAACRVLRQANARDLKEYGEPVVLVALSTWIGSKLPDPVDPALRPILAGEVFWANDAPPDYFIPIGTIPPTREEAKLKCNTLAGWQLCESQPLYAWRMKHDRKAFLAEIALEEAEEEREEEEAERAAQAQQKVKTLKELASHRFFASWSEFPKEAIKASRDIMKQTVKQLIGLGPKATTAKKKAMLKKCIEAFNDLDEEHDHFIETTAREDICDEFHLLVLACGMGKFEDMADEWRDW